MESHCLKSRDNHLPQIEMSIIAKFLADYPKAEGIVARRGRGRKIKLLKVAITNNDDQFTLETINALRANVKRFSMRVSTCCYACVR